MKYSLETIILFCMALFIALVFVCGSAIEPLEPVWSDIVLRLGGSCMIFILGFAFAADLADKQDGDKHK